jgi:uncharacterized protein with von Willebrand factor type A (vWA) domain
VADGPALPVKSGPERAVVGFARLLRGLGLEVPLSSVIVYARALGEVGLDRREAAYWTGRATLVRRPEDVALYDIAFAYFFGGASGALAHRATASAELWLDSEDDDERPPEPEEAGLGNDQPAVTVRYSRAETLRHQDFARYSDQDWAEARRLLAALRQTAIQRRSRRLSPVRHDRGTPDIGRTVRRALRTGGEPIDRAWRSPSSRPRRLVYLVDISGSMEPYARAFLRLAHASVSARGAGMVEVFVLGTRLTRITRPLSWRDPDAALADAASTVEDWYGGTRLGDGLRAFNDRWGTRGMARGSVVVILSDGWDRGEPEDLGTEMSRLRRVAHRIIWVNPLKASPGYAPLARGMAAALPFVDEFVQGHSLAALEQLASRLGSGTAGAAVPSRRL